MRAVPILRAAQRAWIAFRDLDCVTFSGPMQIGGSYLIDAELACLAERTNARIEQLRDLARSYE